MLHRYCLLIMAAIAILPSGCVWPFNQFYNRSVNDAPIVFTEKPSGEQIIQTVNANSQRVHALESQVKVTVDGMPGITGNLALEKPRNFRLQANLLGVSGLGADVGSNDELFWVWVKTTMPGQTPQILYARHAEYAVSPARQLMPIDPTWIRDALGLTEFAAGDRHEGPFDRSDGQLEMRTRLQTPTGPQTRITVVDPKYGWITEQMLLDGQGAPIIIARSSRHRYYQEVGVSLPQRVTIQVAPSTPQAQTLTVDAQSYSINRLSGDPAMLWTMPDPPGVPLVDLAAPIPGQMPISSPNFSNQPAGGAPGYPSQPPGFSGNSTFAPAGNDPYASGAYRNDAFRSGPDGTGQPPGLAQRNTPLDRPVYGSRAQGLPENYAHPGDSSRGSSIPNYRGRLLR